MAKQSELPIVAIVISVVGVVMGCLFLAVAGYFLFFGRFGSLPAAASPTATLPRDTPTAMVMTTAEPTGIPTETPVPTTGEQPTGSPEEPTATTSPTDSAPPPTNPPAPTSPPPTDTPVPTDPPGQNTYVTNPVLSVDSPTITTSQNLNYSFSVTNASSTEQTSLGLLGVVLFKDGQNLYFKTNWRNWVLEPGQTVSWSDHINPLTNPGVYQVQLSLCMPTAADCDAGGGEWFLLGSPVNVTVQ